jgi:hypothetical protein
MTWPMKARSFSIGIVEGLVASGFRLPQDVVLFAYDTYIARTDVLGLPSCLLFASSEVRGVKGSGMSQGCQTQPAMHSLARRYGVDIIACVCLLVDSR